VADAEERRNWQAKVASLRSFLFDILGLRTYNGIRTTGE
jgi:hypothetical protein